MPFLSFGILREFLSAHHAPLSALCPLRLTDPEVLRALYFISFLSSVCFKMYFSDIQHNEITNVEEYPNRSRKALRTRDRGAQRSATAGRAQSPGGRHGA